MAFQQIKWLGLMGVLVVAGQARAFAEEGALSKAALSEMGLSGLTVMSDDEAMSVRGEGFKGGGSSASAWGSSWANVSTPFGSAGSKNGYNAHGKHSASGENFSFAGFVISVSHGKDHGGKPPKDGGGMGGNWGGDNKGKMMGGNGGWGGMGGGKGGKGGGMTTTIIGVVFAGGSSSAHAH